MSIPLVLSVLLMLGGLGGASDLQVYEKSLHRDKSRLGSSDGRHTVRKQPHQQIKGEISRSLDLESFNLHVTPKTTRFNHPTIIKIHPPTAQPLHLHANMPMRFGRDNEPGEENSSNLKLNLPQRFGRSGLLFPKCAKCRRNREVSLASLPQRFGRNSPNWSLLRALAREQLTNAGFHWDEDFTTSPEEDLEME